MTRKELKRATTLIEEINKLNNAINHLENCQLTFTNNGQIMQILPGFLENDLRNVFTAHILDREQELRDLGIED